MNDLPDAHEQQIIRLQWQRGLRGRAIQGQTDITET